MVRISSLPDLSRFVRRKDKLPVYNTVHLLVGEDTIEVSSHYYFHLYSLHSRFHSEDFKMIKLRVKFKSPAFIHMFC